MDKVRDKNNMGTWKKSTKHNGLVYDEIVETDYGPENFVLFYYFGDGNVYCMQECMRTDAIIREILQDIQE